MAEKPQRLQYSAYLLRDHIRDPEQAFRPKYRASGKQPPHEHAAPGNPDMRAYSWTPDEKTPRWATALDGEFEELSLLRSRTNSFVVVVPTEGGRLIAFTFGYGHNTLDPDAYEPSFGLRVAARLLDADEVHSVESRSLDASARRSSVTVSAGQHVESFGFDFDGDWVRRLVGRVEPAEGQKLGDLVSAADSFKFKSDTKVSTAVQKVSKFLEQLNSTEGREDFDFLDNLTALKPGTHILRELNQALVKEIFESPGTKTALAPVENLSFDHVDYYSVHANGREAHLEQLHLEDLVGALKDELGVRKPSPALLDRVQIVAVGHQGDEISQQLPLKKWLVHEVSPEPEETYILTLGNWFKLSNSYRQRVDRKLREIADVSDELAMPQWPHTEREDAYNQRASREIGALCMDTLTGKSSLGRARAEFCDILTRDRTFIHVKRADSSQSLSHLFVQGSASGALLGYDLMYMEEFRNTLKALDSSHPALADTVPKRVVYAVGTRKLSDIYDSLFTVAKVALLVHKKENDRTKAKTALCKIEQI